VRGDPDLGPDAHAKCKYGSHPSDVVQLVLKPKGDVWAV
jgi:hypothetical protein